MRNCCWYEGKHKHIHTHKHTYTRHVKQKEQYIIWYGGTTLRVNVHRHRSLRSRFVLCPYVFTWIYLQGRGIQLRTSHASLQQRLFPVITHFSNRLDVTRYAIDPFFLFLNPSCPHHTREVPEYESGCQSPISYVNEHPPRKAKHARAWFSPCFHIKLAREDGCM